VSNTKKKGGSRSAGINFHGENFIGHTASPLWWNYEYEIKVILGDDEVFGFSGKSDSVSSARGAEIVEQAMAKHQGKPYLSRSDFTRLWEALLMRIK